VRAKPYEGTDAEAVFENLLPEGTLRDALGMATKHSPGDTLGLLGVVGGECAGALQLWPPGEEPPSTPRYAPFTPGAVATAFAGTEWQLRQMTGRASLSGSQRKLALWRRPPAGGDTPEYRLPRDGAPTTVVVKRAGDDFPHLLECEMVGMRLMAAAGVPTAPSVPSRAAPGCHESARFDRVMDTAGVVRRLHAEDGCQLTGRLSKDKYGGRGGPTFAQLCAVLDRRSVDAFADRQLLFRWAAANAALGNYDGHAKNVSVLYEDNALRLAPAYDVVVTSMYPSLDREFGLAFCGTTKPQALHAASLRIGAREFRLDEAQARALADDVTRRVAAGLPAVLHEVAGLGGDGAALDEIGRAVTMTVTELRTRLGLGA
jgi:serine/threonine-protein kinase HipA